MTRSIDPGRVADAAPVGRPRAFTLLEVLVSMGIIIGALAGIAALLPAAGSRLGEATDADRAGTLSANAMADLANRRVLSTAIWTASTPAIVFGQGLPALAGVAAGIGAASLGTLITDNDFILEDSSIGGGAPGVCYGCMLSADSRPSGPGASVRLTTVVFRQPGPELRSFPLVRVGGSTFRVGTGSQVASDRRRFLSGCSWVFATECTKPQWVQIASSWTTFVSGTTTGMPSGDSFVSLVNPPAGDTLVVYGFDGLLRLDERFVNLE